MIPKTLLGRAGGWEERRSCSGDNADAPARMRRRAVLRSPTEARYHLPQQQRRLPEVFLRVHVKER